MNEWTVIAENLADADRLLSDGWRLRRAQLSELSGLMQTQLRKRLERGEETEQTLASLYGEYAEQLNRFAPLSDQRELAQAVSLFSRLELCRMLAIETAEEDLPLYGESHPVIAYFQNPYAGRILQCVTDLLPGAEATDAEDYSDACEGTAEGRYDFCLLPVESAGDGVMNRFAQLIDRYGLFTVLICHLALSEEEYIRFALLSATPCMLEGADRLKLRAVPGEERLWELLLACQTFGAEPEGCRSLPGAANDTYELTLRVQDADVASLIRYLELCGSRSTVTGCYRQVAMPLGDSKELLY